MDVSEPQIFDFHVLIPYYNNWQGLIASLKSICYNTHQFSIVIVDDGSQVPLESEQLYEHIDREMRIHVIRLPVNAGITMALNTGLQWLQEQRNALFTARLDCGDLCDSTRFQKQVDFLREHPEIDLVGTWCYFKDPVSGQGFRYITPTTHDRILKGMYFRNLFIHPTVMWRCSAMQRVSRYPESYPDAEDYGFFYELMLNGRVAVIPEYLVTCEINGKGISLQSRKKQLQSRIKVVREYGTNSLLRLLGIAKLRLLLIVPYGMVFKLKKWLYGI